MKTMNINTDQLKDIIDCLDYAIGQITTSRIAVTRSLTADDSEECFDRMAWDLNNYKTGLESLVAKGGIMIVN